MAVLLKVVGGARKGLELRTPECAAITIGRSKGNDFHVLEATVSRVHAIVGHDDSGWYVEDRESTHGVWVADERVRRARLDNGGEFRIGLATVVRFELVPGAALVAPGQVEVAPKCGVCGRVVAPRDRHRDGRGRAQHIACRNLDHLVGEDLGGFRIVEPIAALGEGFYFRAHQPSLARPVTLAVFDPPMIARPGYRDALLAEVRGASRFVHPNVLQILDFGEARGLSYVVIERFEGTPLADVLAERRFARVRDAADVGVKLLSAACHALGQGATFSWLSPRRVLVSAAHDVKLWLFRDPGRPASPLGADEAAYVAPERAGCVADDAPDSALVYSAAAVLYHMLAGAPPFGGATVEETLRRARVGRAPALRRVNLKVGPALASVVEAGLSRRPDERPGDLEQLRRQVARAAGLR